MLSLDKISTETTFIITLLKQHIGAAFLIVLFIWLIHIINTLIGKRLNILGIYPRHFLGLPGIFLSPMLHADFNHLFFNTFPLLLLIDFTMAITGQLFWPVTLIITFLSGLLVWLFGRHAIHVGASGLIMGYWGFLLALAYYEPSGLNIIVVIIMIYYLGGLITNLFPSDERVSFEGHIFGALAGGCTAFLFIAYPWVFRWLPA